MLLFFVLDLPLRAGMAINRFHWGISHYIGSQLRQCVLDPDGEIWMPDVQPYNTGEAVASTLEPSLALVYSDGTVYWSRPGARRERS